MMWERPIQHSIRPDKTQSWAFRRRYRAPLSCRFWSARPKTHRSIRRSFSPARPTKPRGQFSYASEHVTHGAAITSLLACKTALERASKLLTGPWPQQIAWIDAADQSALETERSLPRPGQRAFGAGGRLQRHACSRWLLSATLSETDDPWLKPRTKYFARSLRPSVGSSEDHHYATQSAGSIFTRRSRRRAALLRLLARFELTPRSGGAVVRAKGRDRSGP